MATLGDRLAALSDASPHNEEKRATQMVATIEQALSEYARERGSKTLSLDEDDARNSGIEVTPLVAAKLRAQHVDVRSTMHMNETTITFTWPVAPVREPVDERFS